MPSQNSLQHSGTKPQFVGFAGRIGAGKTTAAKYLSLKYDLQYVRYSQVLRQWLAPDHPDQEQLQQLGWKVMGGGMQAELNARLIAGLDRTRGAAIDGLRHPIDFECLSAALGPSFDLIFLEAAPKKRFERLSVRFSSRENFEMADSQPVESHIDELKVLSSITITNDESLERLYEKLDAWMTVSQLGEQS